ncbi:hypothetical protein BDA96_02G431000 [Sorghum bicolor]|uniref:Uncharacterized protein n=1 Tax=Sorghum bicolor TaxID=4558 RepID=A0A921RTK0_SORBI|nr:hypothetical protein BDA96_02G431000 [Sorghum bicolor]
MRWAVAAAAAPGDDEDALYADLEAHGVQALEMLISIEPPAHLIGKADLIKDSLEKAVKKAKSKEEKIVDCVMALLYGIYGVVDLGNQCAPKEALAVLNLNKEWFHVMGLAARVDDTDAVMESVICALRIAKHSLQRCIGHTADGAKKLLRFEDIEDW